MQLSLKIFLKDEDDYVFGPGRRELLKAVDELGSLQKAAQSLGMSYRWAWGRLKEAENNLGVALLTRTDKAVSGRPKVLTPEGKALLNWYAEVEKELKKAALKASRKRPEFLAALSETDVHETVRAKR